MANGNGNGDAVRITRATLALIIGIAGPVATVVGLGYHQRAQSAVLADHEERLRAIEREQMLHDIDAKTLSEQKEHIADLEKQVRELTRQLDQRR